MKPLYGIVLKPTFHDQDVARVAICLEQASIQQLPPISLCNPVYNPVHCCLAFLLGQLLGFVPQASDLDSVQEVHDQQAPGDETRYAARDLNLLEYAFVSLQAGCGSILQETMKDQAQQGTD